MNIETRGAIAVIHEGKIAHYICQEDGKLVERNYDDGDLRRVLELGPAKAGTPASYLLLDEGERAFYSLNANDVLQDFEFDKEYGRWEKGELDALEAVASPDAEIAVARTADGTVHIFFQDSTQALQSLERGEDDEDWKQASGIPTTLLPNNPSIYAVNIGDTLRVFYTHQDKSIHELVYDGKWTESIVDKTETDTRKSNIIVTPLDEELYTLQFLEDDGKLWVVHDGKLSLRGKYDENGVFKKDKGAETFSGQEPKVAATVRRTGS